MAPSTSSVHFWRASVRASWIERERGVGAAHVLREIERCVSVVTSVAVSSPRASWRWVVLVAAVLVAGCGGSDGYSGPGTDHPFVGRSWSEVEPCGSCAAGTSGVLDGQKVYVGVDLAEDGPQFSYAITHCGELRLVVDGDTIVAATEDPCP